MHKIDSLLKNKNYRLKSGRLIFIKPCDQLKGKLPQNPSAVRERLHPRLYDYSYIMTFISKKIFTLLLNLLLRKKRPLKILDLGCGYKPFQSLFPNDQYLGVDISLNSYADIIADNHHLPFKDNVFDVIIITEVLEHCEDEYQVINELRRVSKNQALVYLSLPFIFPLHGIPYDFNRFTKYKLRQLFRQDKIIILKESNNLFSSFFIFSNTILRILFGSIVFLYPIYVINNLLGIGIENLSRIYWKKKGFIAQYWKYALTSFPIGYSMIIKIKK